MRYIHEICGMNSRLDAIQAAVLRVKLRHFKDELKKRCENARKYNDFFAEYNSTVDGTNGAPIAPQEIANGNTSTYAQYTVLAEDRKSFIEKLDAAEIPYCINYPQPLHTQPCFKGLVQACESASRDGASNATGACQKVVSLPFCAFTDVDEIIARLKKEM